MRENRIISNFKLLELTCEIFPSFGCIVILERCHFLCGTIFFLRGKVTVNFELMSMQFGSSDEFLLRRLSTPSYIQEPGNVLSTKWVWYWEDDNGWKKYAKTEVDTIILLLYSRLKHSKLLYYHEICSQNSQVIFPSGKRAHIRGSGLILTGM